MNKQRLKQILIQLKDIIEELESEIYSDKESYLPHLKDSFDYVLEYYHNNDDDGQEGL